MSSETLAPRALDLLDRLVAFDTTSRLSNLALIEWVEGYLDGHGVSHRRVPNAEGTKSNLIATIGPAVEGGVVLSGHTDVVPVDASPGAAIRSRSRSGRDGSTAAGPAT